MSHPAEELLNRFAQARASRRENREIVLHLLQGCSACSRRISRDLEALEAGLLPGPIFGARPESPASVTPSVA
jgi:hypothetical protein